MTWAQDILAVLSGGAVGFSLGLIGGGGSILAVPLLVYVVGLSEPHAAIGTSALAVAVSAFANLMGHWRSGTVKWPCATVFAAAGIIGAALGSTLGKLVEGQKLLFLFAVLMIAVGISMLRPRKSEGDSAMRITPRVAVRLVIVGVAVGGVSGFFGIGGGFLIVPGLIYGAGLTMLNAIGSSLVSVTAFGLTTAANYALAGWVEWSVAAEFIAGGVAGGLAGQRLAHHLSKGKRTLTYVFVGIIFAVAIYMLIRSGARLLG